MDSFLDSTGLVVLAAAVVLAFGLLVGAGLTLLGVWVWYTMRLVSRIERRGDLYLSDWDNEQARKLRLAADMATGITYMRQALKALDPERAREFTSVEDLPQKGKGNK